MGPGMDEGDAELGAHERELLGAEARPVVDEQACREASAGDGVFERRSTVSNNVSQKLR